MLCMIQSSYTAGPREPWHDLHCKVEGPAAYDILTNFEQRWRKAKKWRNLRLKKVTNWHDDALLRLDRISWILTPSTGSDGDAVVHVTEENDPETWNVQVWRKYVDRHRLFALSFFTISYKDYKQALITGISVHRFRICQGFSKGC